MEISQLGASGAVVVTVVLFLKFMREESSKRDLTYLKIAKSLDKNTHATKTADTYLRARNGRDSEHHAELMKISHSIVDRLNESAVTLAKDTKNVARAVEEKRIIAEEDRDVLTNQIAKKDEHIAAEVKKAMSKKN